MSDKTILDVTDAYEHATQMSEAWNPGKQPNIEKLMRSSYMHGFVAGGENTANLRTALLTCLQAMDVQLSRQKEEVHINAATAFKIWTDATIAGREALGIDIDAAIQ